MVWCSGFRVLSQRVIGTVTGDTFQNHNSDNHQRFCCSEEKPRHDVARGGPRVIRVSSLERSGLGFRISDCRYSVLETSLRAPKHP